MNLLSPYRAPKMLDSIVKSNSALGGGASLVLGDITNVCLPDTYLKMEFFIKSRKLSCMISIDLL